jgi:cardiolipin synthase
MGVKREELVQRGKRSLRRVIFSRTGLIALLFLTQVGLLGAVFIWFQDLYTHVLGGTLLLTAGAVLVVLNSALDPTAKLTWMVVITAAPVFGSLFYWYTRRDVGHQLLREIMTERQHQSRRLIDQDPKVFRELENMQPGAAGMARYVRRSGCFPVYDGTAVTYFPSGEQMLPRLLEELERAERFIFLEYFILDEGEMWDAILAILKRKAAAGVDVRVMYDGTCEFTLLPREYPRELEKLGIQCQVFAPLEPFVSTHYNYRDHRKIAVIDGHTAFTGGVNLADEYINRIEKYGHWKDTALMLRGPAAASFTVMFLQLWSADSRSPEYHKFLRIPPASADAAGFVMPYSDSPLDADRVGEQVYLDLLNRAKKYVHIMTPYLILDAQMESALCYAARRGVDVRIILPGIPDKKVAYYLAKTHFPSLNAAGVKLYTYTPGFVHAKSFVVDDTEAVVGTINLDYRSLYHHFECAVYLNRVPAVWDIEADFTDTLKKCRRVTRETIKAEKWTVKLAGFVLKTIAPLL